MVVFATPDRSATASTVTAPGPRVRSTARTASRMRRSVSALRGRPRRGPEASTTASGYGQRSENTASGRRTGKSSARTTTRNGVNAQTRRNAPARSCWRQGDRQARTGPWSALHLATGRSGSGAYSFTVTGDQVPDNPVYFPGQRVACTPLHGRPPAHRRDALAAGVRRRRPRDVGRGSRTGDGRAPRRADRDRQPAGSAETVRSASVTAHKIEDADAPRRRASGRFQDPGAGGSATFLGGELCPVRARQRRTRRTCT